MKVIERLFIPVAADREFRTKADSWMSQQETFPWDTSVFKVIDNLIIGVMQQRKAKAVGSGGVRINHAAVKRAI